MTLPAISLASALENSGYLLNITLNEKCPVKYYWTTHKIAIDENFWHLLLCMLPCTKDRLFNCYKSKVVCLEWFYLMTKDLAFWKAITIAHLMWNISMGITAPPKHFVLFTLSKRSFHHNHFLSVTTLSDFSLTLCILTQTPPSILFITQKRFTLTTPS